jgi:hypothetical protein
MAMRIRAELMARRKCSSLVLTAVVLIATLCLRLTDAARGDDDARTRVSAFCNFAIYMHFLASIEFSGHASRHACTGGFHSGPRCFAFIRHLGTDAFEFLSSFGHRAPYLCHMAIGRSTE